MACQQDRRIDSTSCVIRGRYLATTCHLSLRDKFAPENLAATIMNLSNLDGSTNFLLEPSWLKTLSIQGIERLDLLSLWRTWILSTFGEAISFGHPGPNPASELPALHLSREAISRGPATLGINLGGYYARLAYVSASDQILYGPEIKIGADGDSILRGISLDQFCKTISTWISSTGWRYSCVGMALAAPRGYQGIVPSSNLFKPCPQITNAFRSGLFRSTLASQLKCPVGIYNDGECNAVADWFATLSTNQSLYSLKLGTSIACGLVKDNRLSLLPLELAKCIITMNRPTQLANTIHPVTGIRGTLREAVGAGAVSIRYHNSTHAASQFPQFQLDVLAGKRRARSEAFNMAAALADGVALLVKYFGVMPLHIGGKTVEGEFGEYFVRLFKKALLQRAAHLSEQDILLTSWPATYSAAVGAALLGRGEHKVKHGEQ
jgi:predicted NBD/HSP70 family sugar kinase